MPKFSSITNTAVSFFCKYYLFTFTTIEPVNIVDSSSSSSDDYSGNFIVRVSFRIWAEGGEMAICNLIGWGEGIALFTCIALDNVSSKEGARVS